MILAENLTHSYGGTKAIENVSFHVHPGEMFGLIGPDGAGKTTIFRILASLIIPDEGNAYVNSYSVIEDYSQIRKMVGYMPGRFSLYQDLSVEENLRLFATLFGTTIERNYHLIRDIYVQLEPFRTRRAGKLSGGMKQKLALCCALIHRPQVLFLDEPTTGVDPVSRKEFWGMLARLKTQGITIVVSTPYMDEALLCDRIAFIKGGRILQVESPENIMEQYSGTLLAVKADRMHRLRASLSTVDGIGEIYSFGEYFHIATSLHGDVMSGRIKAALERDGFNEIEIREIKPTIEDCFIDKIVQHG